jgi:hypothetical protein
MKFTVLVVSSSFAFDFYPPDTHDEILAFAFHPRKIQVIATGGK